MRSSGDRVLRVQAQLTGRDRLLLDWLADHKVLTTFQICHALFGSLDFAQRRLLKLHRLGLVDRFRPLRAGGGSYPWHYVLDQAGAEIVAASRGETPPRRGETVDRMRRIATSRTLAHRLGVNQFFTDLAGYARTHSGAWLQRWWSEQRCAQPGAFGTTVISPVRPDGHGVFADGGRRVAFFLEWDAGGEQLLILVSKLTGYAGHVRQGGPAWPVLLWLPSTRRERHLHHILDEVQTVVPVATAARDSLGGGDGPADAVWLVAGAGDAPRRLADLAGLGDPAPEVGLPDAV
ncbi:MAG TPA: replication-relaxation family protein [Micromonosporaceae bacterium]|nr:replication-relaxation family protein [Micromonosporaceae bacterium]